MRRSVLFALALFVALAVLSAGCGSSDTTTPEKWAGGVCTATKTFLDSLQAVGTSVASGGISADALKGAADDVKTATKTYGSDLRDLGKPDTASGQQAKETVDTLGTQLGEGADAVEAAVKDVSGVSEIANAVSVVGQTLVTMKSQIQVAIGDLKKLDAAGELGQAFQNADSCASLV